jgi:sigma-B regulation protein RsbU (phosphoserine phosphatase)
MATVSTETDASTQNDSYKMKCMEIWGGMSAADARISTPGLDVHVFAKPYEGDEAGGDVHYLSTCGAGNISRFLLADVSGHGQNVSDLADGLRKLMRRYINSPDASRMAQGLNDAFSDLARDGKFATAIIATYFAPTNQLILVNAGHPRPLWCRAQTQSWKILDGDDTECDETGPKNLPLGVISGTGYQQFAATLEPGDQVVFYTDSLTETVDTEGNMLGEDGLLDVARSLKIDSPDQVGPKLLSQLDTLRGSADADDDLTLMTIHHNGEQARIGLGERLGAMAKLIGLVPV